MTVELTLESNYVRNWHLEEGIREFISNAFDARREQNCDVDISLREHNNKLIIVTSGATLSREVLLFGHSTKMDRSDLIGQFGEGLKLGSLACVRDGYSVVIRTGSEVWRPIIRRSESYNAEVLAIEISKGHKYQNRVAVEIEGITPEMWVTIKKNFLELESIPEEHLIHCPNIGMIITHPDYAGRMYVKGIKVMSDSNFLHGYNFERAEVDRDRKMINTWEIKSLTRQLWFAAVAKSPKHRNELSNMLAKEAQDVEVPSWNKFDVDFETRASFAKDFIECYGETAFPVANMAEAKEVEFYGYRGVVVAKSYLEILSAEFGTFSDIKEKFKNATEKLYSADDLSEAEIANLDEAISDVELAVPEIRTCNLNIVKFKDSRVQGIYNSVTQEIQISIGVLSSLNELRTTLVHEYAHKIGGDGTKDHEDLQCQIWADMFSALKSKA